MTTHFPGLVHALR